MVGKRGGVPLKAVIIIIVAMLILFFLMKIVWDIINTGLR